MSQTLIKREATIRWIVKDQAICKFKDEDIAKKVYSLSDDVVSAVEKLGLDGGMKVEVEIDTSKVDEDIQGVIVSIVKFGEAPAPKAAEAPKAETKTQAPKAEVNNNGIILTVGYIDWNKVWMVFDEQEKVYYSPTPELLEVMKEQKIRKGDKVTIESQKRDKGNILITKLIKLDSAPTSTKSEAKNDYDKKEPETQTKKSYSSDTQKSIEAQAAVNSACDVVASMVDVKTDPEAVLRMIKKIAEHNHNLVQDLKNK